MTISFRFLSRKSEQTLNTIENKDVKKLADAVEKAMNKVAINKNLKDICNTNMDVNISGELMWVEEGVSISNLKLESSDELFILIKNEIDWEIVIEDLLKATEEYKALDALINEVSKIEKSLTKKYGKKLLDKKIVTKQFSPTTLIGNLTAEFCESIVYRS